MHYIKDMLESIDSLLERLSEVPEQLRLHYSVRLCHNQVVSFRELLKSMLQEVSRSRIECSFHTEQSNCKGIFETIWHFRD
jgi:hypothetical protein